MFEHFGRRTQLPPLFAAIVMLLPACTAKDKTPELVRGQTIRGKVTYNGRPVPYGIVLFYNYEKSIDPQTGLYRPMSMGEIKADGTYEVTDAAEGMAMVCVATDPDTDLGSLTLPTAMVGMNQGSLGGGPPIGPPGPAGIPPGGPPIGPGAGPPIGPGAGPPIGPGGGPPLMHTGGPPMGPPGMPVPPQAKPRNPAVDKLSADEKRVLKEIHAKYGIVGKSPVGYPVREGDQTFDIKLK
jgi:hypothetical protein